MRVLITGAAGMLGRDLQKVMADHGHQVIATDIDSLDVRDLGAVHASLDTNRPELVCHLAALTDVDLCERDPDSAYLTNAIGTENVAIACRQSGAVLVYVSTISVFDGTKPEPYTELDAPDPRSHYSRSKFIGEQAVERLVPEHYIVRAGWMFGGGPHDKKFVARILELARQQTELLAVDDKFGSPTYTVDFSEALCRLAETERFGTYHAVNEGPAASRYEVAKEIVRLAGIDSCQVLPASSAHFPLPAPRPRMEAALNYRFGLLGFQWMRPWREALADYLKSDLMRDA